MPHHSAVSEYLHQIESICGIKHLHFHMARHTFATTICLSNGVSMETISKMMGHSSIRSTQIYAEITSQKVGDDMKKLARRIESRKKIM
jgi:site-specific recombinase XerD